MEAPRLTSTTAPGKYFTTRKELADHYKSDWHKYNLKRREAGLPLVLEADFQARLEAALAMREEGRNGGGGGGSGTDHLKNKNKKNKQKQKNNKKQQQQGRSGGSHNNVVVVSQAQAYERMKQEKQEREEEEQQQEQREEDEEEPELKPEPLFVAKIDINLDNVAPTSNLNDDDEANNIVENDDNNKDNDQQENIVIDPKQCLFDRHISKSVEANVDRMYRKYGFFIPDREYLFDLEGLIGYCHEKIKLGHYCLYCHQVFKTYQGCQKHMISKNHCKLRYEHGFDMDELSVFYDFSKADEQFLGSHNKKKSNAVVDDRVEEEDDEEEGEWEDISDDEEAEDDEEERDDDDEMDGFEEQIARFGFDVTPLGELVLPDGRIVGHRTLSRYYKQRLQPTSLPTNTAALTARYTAGERLYDGKVFNMNDFNGSANNGQLVDHYKNRMALAKAGIHPNLVKGRAGKGILHKQEGSGVYSSVSLYRYRAVLKKQKRDDASGERLWNKSKQNINRMDKKANRLMNGVSVAHAAR